MDGITVTSRDHETHRHLWYGLTCADLDALLNACGHACQTCGCPSARTRLGKLVIDHDGSVGNWAVRGLICQHCNSQLRYDRPAPHWAAAYLADPWYRQMLAERGIEALPPEPATYRVLDPERHIWFRRQQGWHSGHARCPVLAWPDLVRRFGPHNLKPFSPAGDVTVIRGRVVL